MEAVAVDPSILECQKAVSTLFWTCVEQLLCVKATLCADTIATLCLRARAQMEAGDSRLPARFHTPPSLFPLRFAPLSQRYLEGGGENVSSAGPPERQSRAQAGI